MIVKKNALEEKTNKEDICYSPEDILTELKFKEYSIGFSKEIPFSNAPPYLDAPFSQFPNFMNNSYPNK